MHLSSQVQTLRKRCVHCEVQGMLVNTWALLMPSLPHANMLVSSTLSTISLCPPSPSQNERHYIMQVVCEATQCAEEPRVRRGTWGGGLGVESCPLYMCAQSSCLLWCWCHVCVCCVAADPSGGPPELGQDNEPLLPVHGELHGTCSLRRESSRHSQCWGTNHVV